MNTVILSGVASCFSMGCTNDKKPVASFTLNWQRDVGGINEQVFCMAWGMNVGIIENAVKSTVPIVIYGKLCNRPLSKDVQPASTPLRPVYVAITEVVPVRKAGEDDGSISVKEA